MTNAENPIYTYIERDVERFEKAALSLINIREKFYHKARLIFSKYPAVIKIGRSYYKITNQTKTLIKAQKYTMIDTTYQNIVFNLCKYVSSLHLSETTKMIIISQNVWNKIKRLAKLWDEMESKKEAAP
jgi:hypothetical protein